MYRLLVVDDEEKIRVLIRKYAEFEGYEVEEAADGMSAIELCRQNKFDLIILDVMMPVMDGITAIAHIREISNVPVIMLTAKSEDTDKILGLNVGADDYVTKPFNPVELIARVKSQLRRYMTLGGGSAKPSQLTIGGIKLDDDSKSVTVDSVPVSLTPREYDILHFLMRNVGTVFSPRDIYRNVWGEEPYGAENAVAVHIRHLREKIEINPADPRYITVVWGKGYKIKGE